MNKNFNTFSSIEMKIKTGVFAKYSFLFYIAALIIVFGLYFHLAKVIITIYFQKSKNKNYCFLVVVVVVCVVPFGGCVRVDFQKKNQKSQCPKKIRKPKNHNILKRNEKQKKFLSLNSINISFV